MRSLEELSRQFTLTSTSLTNCKTHDYRRLTMMARLASSSLCPLREVTDEMVKACNEHQRCAILICPVTLTFKEGTNRWNERVYEGRVDFFVLGYDAAEVLSAAPALLNAAVSAHTEETRYTYLT